MDILQQLLNSQGILKALPIIFMINVGLSCVSLFLQKLGDVTSNASESKIAGYINQVCSMLQKLLDLVGFNPKH